MKQLVKDQLPEMKGSVKQVAWAEDIREKWVNAFNTAIELGSTPTASALCTPVGNEMNALRKAFGTLLIPKCGELGQAFCEALELTFGWGRGISLSKEEQRAHLPQLEDAIASLFTQITDAAFYISYRGRVKA